MEIRILAPRLCTKSSITTHLVGHPYGPTVEQIISTLFVSDNQGGGGGDLDPGLLRLRRSLSPVAAGLSAALASTRHLQHPFFHVCLRLQLR
jgi:hypothetical protein